MTPEEAIEQPLAPDEADDRLVVGGTSGPVSPERLARLKDAPMTRVYPVFATRDWRLPDGTLVATTYLNDAVISLPDTPVLQYVDRAAFCDAADVSPAPPAAQEDR